MKINKAIEEKILFSRLKDKDKEAFSRVYDMYVRQIYRFIYFKVSDKEEAEDLTSAVFLKTWNYIANNNIVEYKNLKSLIYKIARNTIIDHYRKSNLRNNLTIDNPDLNLEVVDNKQDISKQIEVVSEFEELKDKLQELKDEYREVIVLRFINELTITEIAIILNKSKGNIRVLQHRALKALRELMSEQK